MTKFKFFHLTSISLNNCTEALDTPTYNVSDSKRCELCMKSCNCVFLPFTFVLDIITLPFRGTYYIIKKYTV
jgi:uncharacterized protein YceK